MANTTLMSFPKRVRYKHIQYPPNTAFEVDDKDVAGLAQAGGWVIQRPTPVVEDTNINEVDVAPKKTTTTRKKGATKKKEE